MKCIARFMVVLLSCATLAFEQSASLARPVVVQAQPAASPALPPYIIYRHFMAWVTQLDKAASGATDPYQFAQPFSRANLQPQHLDILRTEAHKLDADLQQHQARVQKIITQYRKDATAALSQGQPLPPVPDAIRDLNRQRTAIMVQHYANLRASLGTDVSAQLDSYLNYEFAPHISLKGVSATPGTPIPH